MKIITFIILSLLLTVLGIAQEKIKKQNNQKFYGLIENNGEYQIVTDSGYISLAKRDAYKLYLKSIGGDTANIPLILTPEINFPMYFVIDPVDLISMGKIKSRIIIPLKQTNKDTAKKNPL